MEYSVVTHTGNPGHGVRRGHKDLAHDRWVRGGGRHAAAELRDEQPHLHAGAPAVHHPGTPATSTPAWHTVTPQGTIGGNTAPSIPVAPTARTLSDQNKHCNIGKLDMCHYGCYHCS